MEKQKFARQMQNDMLQQIQEARPKFLVYADVARSWGTKATLEDNRGFLEMAWAYAHRGYELVDQVAIAGDPEHLFGTHACLYVFRRIGP